MRILVASGIVAPEIGGPATFITTVVPELTARGHEVRVVAFADDTHPPADDAVPVHRIVRGPLAGRLAAYARTYRALASGSDVVLALGVLLPRATPGGVPVALKLPGDYAWERAVSRGWIAPDTPLDDFERAPHRLRTRLLKWWRRTEARRADGVVVPSVYLADLAASWGVDRRRIVVVPNAIGRIDPGALAPRAILRRDLGWRHDEPVLVVVGRLVAWKHVDLVIDAVSRLAGIRLVIVGDGPQRRWLEAHAAERRVPAVFLGAQPARTVHRVLRAADYLVLYSSYEGLSHAALEARALGTPVVASRRGGNPEIVRHGVNGLLVDHPDVAALASALDEAISPGRRDRLAEGTSLGLEAFSVDRAASALDAALGALVAHGRRTLR